MANFLHPSRPSRTLRRAAYLPLTLAALALTACGSSSSSSEDPAPETAGGAAGAAGAAGTAGKGGSAGKGGAAGSAQGGAGTAGSAGGAATGGQAGTAGGAGAAGTAGKGAAGGAAGTGGQGGSSGSAGKGGAAGTGGAAGMAGKGGAAGNGTDCAGMPGLGEACSTGLKGLCGQGHNKCVQGVLSCAPDFPEGKPETCNGEDDDCDGQIDNGLPTKTFYQDNDGDGFGSTATASSCQAPAGYADKSGDCNDNNKDIYPGAAEVCNGVDDNCDGTIDEGVAKNTYFVDSDGDGFGSTATVQACALGPGLADTSSDCNDNNKDIYPGAAEVCNGVDDNCDGSIDEGVSKMTFFVDSDGDGFGSASTVEACAVGPGLTLTPGDCNDTNAAIYPGAVELCNDIDDNCNGAIDEGVQKPTWYKDSDGDGFGGVTSKIACMAPAGYVQDAGDCNDFNKNIYPGAPEVCNEIDDNCDGQVDEGLDLVDVYTDLDGDGHGGKNAVVKKHCLLGGTDAPTGFATNNDDCDDSKSTVYPGAPELCDGVLNNCSLKVADYQCPTKCAGSWPASIGGGYGYVTFAQLDNDAEWEVVAQQSGTTFVFEHDGTLKWKATGSNYSFPSLGDFDHDGFLDVAVPAGGKVVLLRGIDGTVIATVPSPSASVYYGATIFDIDNNGWPDVTATSGGGLDLLRFGPNGALVKSTSFTALAGEPGFNLAPSGYFDLNGDGVAELFAASGSWGCAGNLPTCKGRFFAYNQDGSTFNDPSWQDPAKPWFKFSNYPNSYGGEGYFPVVADFDHDGKAELLQGTNTGTYVWKFDGTDHPLSGQITNSRTYSPINADGTLTDGTLSPVSGPVADIEGDGVYEQFGQVTGGLGVTQKGKLMDGYPIPIGGNQPTVVDINRDGGLDMLWIGDNNAVNCWTMKGGTYATSRVLNHGGIAGLSTPGVYSTGSYDSYEPNQPASPLDPATSANPIGDFRPFQPFGMRDQFVSGGGWRNQLRAAIGTQGDEDYYWFTNYYSNIVLTSDVAQKLNLDLDVFIFVQNGSSWQYTCEAHADNTTNGNVYIHPIQATGTCPVGLNANKGFLVRVKGHDQAKDFGPWPYTLSFMWQ